MADEPVDFELDEDVAGTIGQTIDYPTSVGCRMTWPCRRRRSFDCPSRIAVFVHLAYLHRHESA